MAKLKKKTGSSKAAPAVTPHHLPAVQPLAAYLAVFAFAFLLYSNTLSHGFVMDDGAVISNHETVRKGFGGIAELFGQSSVYGSTKENFGTYRPLTMSFFAIEYALFGSSSAAYHFMHVVLYGLLCVVLLGVLSRLFGSMPYGKSLAFIAVLLFIAHPVHTEVAANVKSADEILSLLFGCLALHFALRDGKTKALFLSGAGFLAALFSKESAATFLLIIPLALYCFAPAPRKNILTLGGIYLSAMVLYFLCRTAALDKDPGGIAVINNALAGAGSFSERYGTSFVILLKYLGLLFFPHPLCWDYGYNQIPLVGLGDIAALASVLIHLALGVFALLALFRPSIFKPSNLLTFKLISFCILFYLISLSVSSNIFVLIGSTMAERFLFTPSLAFCILLAFGLIRVLKIQEFNLKPATWNLKLLPLLVILVLLSYKTYSRNRDWQSNLTLFAKGVEDSPDSYRTNVTYAWETVLDAEKEQDKQKRKEKFEKAVTYYKKGLAIYDKVEADWYNYGVSSSNLGNVEEAMKAYQRALEINPGHRNSAYNLGTVYLSRKDFTSSLKYFMMVHKADSGFMDAAFKVGLNYQFMNDHRSAIPYYETYYRKNPGDKNVVSNLMIAHRTLGEIEKAGFYMGILARMNR